jgi:hypothetical protein
MAEFNESPIEATVIGYFTAGVTVRTFLTALRSCFKIQYFLAQNGEFPPFTYSPICVN